MPQLDTATYLPQVFWLLIVFFIFYVLVLQYLLPKLSTILKVRSKKLNEGSHILGEMSSENNELGAVYDNILTKSLKESERLIQISNNGAFSWVDSSSQKHCAAINSFYLKSIGNLYAKRGLLRKIVSHLLHTEWFHFHCLGPKDQGVPCSFVKINITT